MTVSKGGNPGADPSSHDPAAGGSSSQQRTIGEGTAQQKSGGQSMAGNLDQAGGTTPGQAEGKEADVDEALRQQPKSSKPR